MKIGCIGAQAAINAIKPNFPPFLIDKKTFGSIFLEIKKTFGWMASSATCAPTHPIYKMNDAGVLPLANIWVIRLRGPTGYPNHGQY